MRSIYEQVEMRGGLCALKDLGWMSSAHEPCLSQWSQPRALCILLVQGGSGQESWPLVWSLGCSAEDRMHRGLAHSLSCTCILEVTRGGAPPEGVLRSGGPGLLSLIFDFQALFWSQWACLSCVLLTLDLVPSAFLSHSSLFFLKSLKKKLTILQETLKLPPGDSETINRLVLERFVDPLGWNRDSKLVSSLVRVSSPFLALSGVGGPGRPEGCGPPVPSDSQE